MVIGVGFDLSSTASWKSLLDEGRTLAIEEMFTPAELERARQHPEGPAPRLASRYAAKEAFIKAFGRNDLALREIVVERRENGAPYLTFSDQLLDRIPQIRTFSFHLSLSHSRTTATAVVVIES